MRTDRHGETNKRIFANLVWNTSATWRTIGQELVEWKGKVSINTTKVVMRSINTQIEFLFTYRYVFRSSWDNLQAVL
jgi:hypothetical protein